MRKRQKKLMRRMDVAARHVFEIFSEIGFSWSQNRLKSPRDPKGRRLPRCASDRCFAGNASYVLAPRVRQDINHRAGQLGAYLCPVRYGDRRTSMRSPRCQCLIRYDAIRSAGSSDLITAFQQARKYAAISANTKAYATPVSRI
jgi:hypothetical protein